MSAPGFLAQARQHLAVATSLVALVANLGSPLPVAAQDSAKDSTATPIKHVIVIIGENRTFDHVFATYQPRSDDTVSNLLSKGIVNSDGTPGPNFSLASQSAATDSTADGYKLSPPGNVAYPVLPPVLAGGYTTPPFPDVTTAKLYEYGLPASYYVYLHRRYQPEPRGRRHSYSERLESALWSLPANLGYPPLRFLRQQPSPPLLPDVAAGRLQHSQGYLLKSQRMHWRPFPLG